MIISSSTKGKTGVSDVFTVVPWLILQTKHGVKVTRLSQSTTESSGFEIVVGSTNRSFAYPR